MAYNTYMRILFKHWAIFSLPLLLILAVLYFGFASESDVATFFEAHRAAHPNIKIAMELLTDWSNPVFYCFYGIMLVRAFVSGNRENKRYLFILLAVQAVVAAACVHFIKYTVGRPRPDQTGLYHPLSAKGGYHSLPSGHTTEIIGWSLPLAFRRNGIRLTEVLGLFVGLVGFSRVYLGWHHPTDVFFGWLLGSFGAFATHIIADSTLFRKQ